MFPALLIDDLHLRPLAEPDAPLVVEATSGESEPSLWGPRPVGPYTLDDARAALRDWDPAAGGQVSFGVLRGERLVAALGLMPGTPEPDPTGATTDGRGSAEVAYWVRPEERGQGIAARAVRALSDWAHATGTFSRLWLEIEPGNAASLRVAERAGYRFERRLPRHCRSWAHDDETRDSWHDCLIWVHRAPGAAR